MLFALENVVQEPSILVCNSVGGVVGLRAAIDRYVRDFISSYVHVYLIDSSISTSIQYKKQEF